MSPRSDAMVGNAVATIVWSATARNIGSMIDGKMVRNRCRGGFASSVSPTSADESSDVPGRTSAVLLID